MKSILLLLIAAVRVSAADPSITKVEPPNWWPNHTVNPVRLLIRGTGLQGAKITAPHGLKAANARVNSTGTYLLVDVTVSHGARPGDYPLEISTAAGKTTAAFRLDAPLDPTGRFQGFSSDDVIYLIMPDRFANGDPSNDDPGISKGMFDRGSARQYHGGDIQGVIDHLSYLKSLGMTAIWLTPWYDNTNTPNHQQAVEGKPIADYHGYGTVDYYGVEEHLGHLALLRKLVDEAHRQGLKVIQDQVANHVGPAHPWIADSPTPTWFHGTREHHLNETWQIWNLSDPHAVPVLQRSVLDGWFNNVLPDMNQEDPDVAQYEIQNALWWVGVTGLDAIRQDTLPYVPRSFWHNWSAALHKQYPNLRAVGEVFDGDPAVPSFFQGGVARADGVDSGIDSVFDFPTYFTIRDVFARGKEIDALPKVLAKDRLYPNAAGLVPFLGNHDTMRFMSEPGATVQGLKLAFTYLLTMRGTPELYYGDEIGMPGGEDPDNRHDFPGGWKDDPRSAFEPAGRTEQEQEIFQHVQKLATLRAKCEPLRRGNLKDLVVTSQTWVYARQSGGQSAIIAINNGTAPVNITIPFPTDDEYRAQLSSGPNLAIHNGTGQVHLDARTAEVYLSAVH